MDIQEIISLVTKTQGLIKNREMASHVKEKGLADYVTQVDIAVQNFLKKELFALAPDIQLLGEETGLQEMKAESFWILDPVDGTTNLMHDYQHSVVSLALCRQGEIVIGIVYDPFHEEVFSAIKGKGSFLNGQPIHVSNAEKLSDTIIGLGQQKESWRMNTLPGSAECSANVRMSAGLGLPLWNWHIPPVADREAISRFT